MYVDNPYENFYKIIEGDCLKALSKLEKNSVDLILTSPPYPGAKMWSLENETIEEQTKRLTNLSLNCLKLCSEVVKENGVICWNVSDIARGNFGITITTSLTTVYAIRKLGLLLRGNIIWDKGISYITPPSFMRRPIIPNSCHEHILVFFKGDWKPREKKIKLSPKAKNGV